jgi:hypothetical protein
MSDSKEFEVTVQRGKQISVWRIKAPNKQAAQQHAELLLKRRGGPPPSKVISAKEKS